MPVLIPVIILLSLGVGVSIAVAAAYASEERELPHHSFDEEVIPGQKTGHKALDALLPGLRRAANATGIPLGVLVGWIGEESAGRIGTTPKIQLKGEGDYERGLFQISPSESKSLGLDHKRLSTDLNYSLDAGIALIKKNMERVEKFGVASRGSSYFWMLVKMIHTIGIGALTKILAQARTADKVHSWKQLRDYAIEHEKELFQLTKHSPKKWFGFMDRFYRAGAPFGFGGGDVVVGGQVFDDIIDPIDALRII